MTQSNDSVLVTPGTGATIATHNPGDAKEYQVVMIAGSSGHIRGTKNTHILYAPPVSVVGASKLHFDLWNGEAATKMTILWMSFFSDLDVAVVGVLATRIDVFRSTAIGTTGTAFTNEATTAVRTISRADSGGTALPAGITAREAPGGGATAGAFLGSTYVQPEETATSMGYMNQSFNMFAALADDSATNLIVPTSSGLRIVQGPVAGLGKVGCRIVFTLE